LPKDMQNSCVKVLAYIQASARRKAKGVPIQTTHDD